MLQLSHSLRSKDLVPKEDAYEVCRQITAEYSKTFYLGTLLMTPAKRRAIWAIYVWCRRTDELVDGPQAALTTKETLDRWEKQLHSIFQGHPVEDTDVALVDTLKHFPLDIQPFIDMIDGQRMDLDKDRYRTFEELELYCYRVAGTVGLMSTTVMGVDPSQATAPWRRYAAQPNPTQEAVALGIANQLTNILRDVGEDARRGRIYLPLDDLALFDYTEADLMNGVIDDRWRALMQFEIQRARKFYQQAEAGISQLSADARWPVWAAQVLYSKILDVIEQNDYDVFNRRAFVPTLKKLTCLPGTLVRSRIL
ncbi:15-cis-phytoene synthase CrtB [Leptolyngbya iicbica]|uniref:15-cis-phytoene synthase n=2 Tax=Cyanophyceae TaxID=3028117 RepID=A0A4Q7E8Q0_9CYAN|nr:phytoene synthase [Leptolyngbya sp. LK]RZM78891.1 phytoene synthase [Leptolyngbya sp. LK]